MPPVSPPLRFLLVALAGWIHQQQRDVIDYLQAENRVLREQLGPRRGRFPLASSMRETQEIDVMSWFFSCHGFWP